MYKKIFLKNKKLLFEILFCIIAFIFICLSYLIFKPLYRIQGIPDGVYARTFIFLLLIILFSITIVLFLNKKLSFHHLVIILVVFGLILKINYMLITPYNYRQHDVITNDMVGHEGYAWTIFTTGKLPNKIDSTGHLAYQFYHPPLNAFVQSTFMHLMKPILQFVNFVNGTTIFDTNDVHVLFETSEILATFYMLITCIFAIKTIGLVNISNKAKLVGIGFICLFPAFIIFSAQENNDPISIMCCFIALYYTMKWWNSHTYGSAIGISLAVGLGMMAKFSAAVIAIPAICIFVYVLINAIKNSDKQTIKKLVIQAIIVIAIAFPLGFWYQILVMVKYNQPLGFVFSNLNQALYTGNHNFFERFINIFDFSDLFALVFTSTSVNYNVFNFLIKSSLFGEYSFLHVEYVAIVLTIINYLFVLCFVVLLLIYLIKTKKEHLTVKIIMGSLFASQLLAMLYFNIKMPYGCTMDFRYIAPILMSFALFIPLMIEKFNSEKGIIKGFSVGLITLTFVLLGLSTSFYLFAI